jgi:hypothetical protein
MSRFSYPVGRFSGVHVWPVLGVPRGDQNRPFRRSFAIRFSSRRIQRPVSALRFRSSTAAADRRPCFHLAFRQRSRPSDVRGPVEAPPHSAARIFARLGCGGYVFGDLNAGPVTARHLVRVAGNSLMVWFAAGTLVYDCPSETGQGDQKQFSRCGEIADEDFR